MSYILSICLPAIRPHNWVNLYASLQSACPKHAFELVIISPYDLPESLKKVSNIKLIKDFGTPTRAAMLGSTFCTGQYIAIPADDGYFFPDSFKSAIHQIGKSAPNDIIVLRYREGAGMSGKVFPDSYWFTKTHLPVSDLHIGNNWLCATQPLLSLNYFREIGGFDCRFEHLAFATHDFSYRAQRNGSTLHLSKTEVMNADHFIAKTGDHAPVHYGQTENDQPLFMQMYQDPNVVNRIKIDFDNWKSSPEVWVRRWPNGIPK